ncbi:DUF4870 domain-containing protein [Nibricoccus aquaticus]|nr:DUF4870 domain-containing protein [Nibricoccus aquaticus]
MDTATPPSVPGAPAPAARTWEMLAHLSALAGLLVPLGSFLGPFIIWQIKKNEFPSVEAHAKASLNFQLSCLIYAVISAIFIIVGIGILFLMAVGIFSLVCVIIATIKANNGEPWKYPLSLTLIK